MINITTQDNEAVVSSMVLDYAEFNNTLNNVKKFVTGLPMNELDALFNNPEDFNKVPENRALFNVLNGVDFQEVGIVELLDFIQLIKVIGLDNYELYTIPEYAYMYTSLVDYFEAY